LSADTTISSSVSLNTLTLTGPLTLTINPGVILTIATGGVLAKSGAVKITGGGTLAFAATDGVLTTDNGLTIDAQITGSSGVTMAGTGQVSLAQTNLGLTGGDALNGGTLTLGAVGALGGGAL